MPDKFYNSLTFASIFVYLNKYYYIECLLSLPYFFMYKGIIFSTKLAKQDQKLLISFSLLILVLLSIKS